MGARYQIGLIVPHLGDQIGKKDLRPSSRVAQHVSSEVVLSLGLLWLRMSTYTKYVIFYPLFTSRTSRLINFVSTVLTRKQSSISQGRKR